MENIVSKTRGNLLESSARERCQTIYLDFNVSELENENNYREVDDDGFETMSESDDDQQELSEQVTTTSIINNTTTTTTTIAKSGANDQVYCFEYGILGEDSHTQCAIYKNRLYNSNIKYEYIGVHSLLDPFMEQPMVSMPTMYQSTDQIILPENLDLVSKLAKLQSRQGHTEIELPDASTMSNHVLTNYVKTTFFSRINPPLDMKTTHALFKGACADEQIGLFYTYGGADFNVIPRVVSRNFLILDLERLTYIQLPIPVNVDDATEQLIPMEGHTMVKRHKKIYIFGGNTVGSEFMNSFYEIDVADLDKFCLELRRRDYAGESDNDIIVPAPKFRKIIGKNHEIVRTRSYHTCEYIPKFDIMVSVAGKVRKGVDAPMLNEILIYHFNRNEFQIITDANIVNPRLRVKDLPYAHVLGSTRIYGYDSFTTLENCYQMAYYGGCSTTNYDSDNSYNPHLHILTFRPSKHDASNVDVIVTKINLKERTSSSYTNVLYHPQTSSFYLYGSYQAQSRDELSIFTMKFASIATITRQFPKLSPQSSYSDISFKSFE